MIDIENHADGIAAIFRHSSAHLWQALAHCWQCSVLYLAHSSPHAWQISAQSAQSFAANDEPRDMNWAARLQISAQSRSSSIHRTIVLMSCSRKQDAAQCSHAVTHSLQASIQPSYCLEDITFILFFVCCGLFHCRQNCRQWMVVIGSLPFSGSL